MGLLVKAGLDASLPDGSGWTPLHCALVHGQAATGASLVASHKADAAAEDLLGRTAQVLWGAPHARACSLACLGGCLFVLLCLNIRTDRSRYVESARGVLCALVPLRLLAPPPLFVRVHRPVVLPAAHLGRLRSRPCRRQCARALPRQARADGRCGGGARGPQGGQGGRKEKGKEVRKQLQ